MGSPHGHTCRQVGTRRYSLPPAAAHMHVPVLLTCTCLLLSQVFRQRLNMQASQAAPDPMLSFFSMVQSLTRLESVRLFYQICGEAHMRIILGSWVCAPQPLVVVVPCLQKPGLHTQAVRNVGTMSCSF